MRGGRGGGAVWFLGWRPLRAVFALMEVQRAKARRHANQNHLPPTHNAPGPQEIRRADALSVALRALPVGVRGE